MLPVTFDPAADAYYPNRRQRPSAFSGSALEDALASMRRTGAHVARVFDAQGNTTGVLFLEDIVEELVGEVQPPAPRCGRRIRYQRAVRPPESSRQEGCGSEAAAPFFPSGVNPF